MTIILEAITGSRAHGLAGPNSDTDYLGIFTVPFEEIVGLDWCAAKETRTDASPEGDDHTYFEVKKAILLLLKANPGITDLVWAKDFLVCEGVGELIVENRAGFLSWEAIRGAYLGIAKNNFLSYSDLGEDGSIKHARHALMYADKGYEILTTGEINVMVSDPTRYTSLGDLEHREVLYLISEAIKKLHGVDSINSPLPMYPDRDMANRLLVTARFDSALRA